ncbi:MAG: glycosyltransferase [Chloroflexia bacterium]
MKSYFHPDIHLLRTAIINSITSAVALGLFLNRRRNPELGPVAWPIGREAPLVEIIIPARDEERNIVPLLETLAGQRYPAGRFRITVVDDGSADGTAERVRHFAGGNPQVRLVQAPSLPAGWTGKNHAMHTGYVASSPDAAYLLFVDADTRHDPLMLSTVVQRTEEADADLLSLVIRVDMEGFWERVLVPQVGELYTLLVGTMDGVNRDGESRGAAANGQFMLMKRAAYEAAISQPGVRSDVAEDRAIAAALKRRGGKVRLEYGQRLARARVYSSLREMWDGYSKTMFWASGHDMPRTLAIVGALSLYAFMPLLSLVNAVMRRGYRARASALRHAPIQLLPMLVLRAAVCRSLGIPMRYALAYPLAVAVGNVMLLFSMYCVVSGRGVRWKGRTYR